MSFKSERVQMQRSVTYRLLRIEKSTNPCHCATNACPTIPSPSNPASGALSATYSAIALPSLMYAPSAVSNAGTCPVGHLARNSGVRLVSPWV